VAKSKDELLIECREMLFGASQSLYVVSAVLKDREMPTTASSVSDLAEMLGEFSGSLSEQVSA
jgi:hypothetical protein